MSSLTSALKQKITSKEQFDKVLTDAYSDNSRRIGKPEVRNAERQIVTARRDYYSARHICYSEATREDQAADTPFSDPYFLAPPGADSTQFIHHTRWWLLRERLRIRFGLYERTDALVRLDEQWAHLAIHNSTKSEDPSMVAYTPDAAAGERDAQVQISLGKLLRKLYPHVGDEVIQNFEALHRGEMSDEVEFITGAEAIENAYCHGPGACMSKRRDQYDCGDDNHPTHVYDAPGVALAVIRNLQGDISGRTMVYVNPDDESDKRYIRLYGDQTTLKRRLEKRGFKLAGWDGVRLRRIVVRDEGHRVLVVMPYIDAPGHNSSNPKCAQYAVLDSDERYVVMVGRETRDKLVMKHLNVPACTSTGGSVWVDKATTIESLMDTCPLTGVRFDSTRTAGSQKVLFEGAMRWAHPSADLTGWGTAHAFVQGGFTELMVPAGTKTFRWEDAYTCVDDVVTREYTGYEALSSKYYDEGSRWVRYADTVFTTDGERLLTRDAVQVIAMADGTPSRVWVHRSEMEGDKAADYVKVHRIEKAVELLAHKDVPMVKTISGRLVVPGVHAVAKLTDGRYDFSHKCESMNVWGKTLWVSKGTSVDSIPSDQRIEFVKARLQPDLDYWAEEVREGERSVESFRLAAAKRVVTRMGFLLGTRSAYTGLTTDKLARMVLIPYGGSGVDAMERWAHAVETARQYLANPDMPRHESYVNAWQAEDVARMTLLVNDFIEGVVGTEQQAVEEAVETLMASPEMLTAAQAVADVAPAPAPRYVIAA